MDHAVECWCMWNTLSHFNEPPGTFHCVQCRVIRADNPQGPVDIFILYTVLNSSIDLDR
jgi:hypothetical protein